MKPTTIYVSKFIFNRLVREININNYILYLILKYISANHISHIKNNIILTYSVSYTNEL